MVCSLTSQFEFSTSVGPDAQEVLSSRLCSANMTSFLLGVNSPFCGSSVSVILANVAVDCSFESVQFGTRFSTMRLEDTSNIDAGELLKLRERFNSKHLPLMLTSGLREQLLKRAGEFPSMVERLYHGIASATGSRIIVDSSKEPHYSYILRTRPSLDVFFLHLVRDPRAVAYSWRAHQKKETGLSYDSWMESRGAMVSSTYFDVSNVAAQLMWARWTDRYKFLRYEDFLNDPEDTFRQIGNFVGEELDPSLVITNGHVRLNPSHTAWGNPNRFERGTVPLKLDETWRFKMPRKKQLAVTAFTLPLVKRYHYPIILGRSAPKSLEPLQ